MRTWLSNASSVISIMYSFMYSTHIWYLLSTYPSQEAGDIVKNWTDMGPDLSEVVVQGTLIKHLLYSKSYANSFTSFSTFIAFNIHNHMKYYN